MALVAMTWRAQASAARSLARKEAASAGLNPVSSASG